MRSRLGLPALLVALCLVPPASAATNLSAYWPLNERTGATVKDRSGNANTGSASGGVAHIGGRFQRALRFDGLDDQVLIARSPSLEPEKLTVEGWVRAGASPGAYRYLVAHGANQCLVPSYGLYTGAGGGLAFVVSGGEETNFTVSPSVGAGLWDGSWHHVAGTFDGASVRLYVDGAEIGTGTPASVPIAYGLPTSNTTLLGAFGAGPCNPGQGNLNYGGDIDEPRIWRRALGAEEIAASAAMGGTPTAELEASVEPNQAIVHTSRFTGGDDIKVSIESSTGTERISEIRISQILPIGSGAGCGGGMLFSPCDITLSNGGKTAALDVKRQTLGNCVVTLKVSLASGRTLYADVAL